MSHNSASQDVPQTPSSAVQACNVHLCIFTPMPPSYCSSYLSMQTTTVPKSASRHMSWEQYLQQYAQRSAPQLATDTVAHLTAAVHESPQDPEAWWSLLAKLDAATHGVTDRRQALALLQVYEWATKQVPRHGNYDNTAFLKMWIGYAKQQW